MAARAAHGKSDCQTEGWPGRSCCAWIVQQASMRTGTAHGAPEAMETVPLAGQKPPAAVARCGTQVAGEAQVSAASCRDAVWRKTDGQPP